MKQLFKIKSIFAVLAMLFIPFSVYASGGGDMPMIGGIRIEFIIFALTLVGVALFHDHTMYVALGGLTTVLILKFAMDSSFDFAGHIVGNEHHEGEWRTLVNLIGLLFGFGILAKHFEESGVPDILPKYLPNDWKGGLVLLALIMVLSSFLDNIAAAMIGGTIALVVFKNKVHIGYVAAIVAASNAGGAGSVVGDTTTTIMWIEGVSPIQVLPAFIASIVAFLFFGFVGAKQQHAFNPISADANPNAKINGAKLLVVLMILVGAVATNYLLDFPAAGVWGAIILGALFTSTPWEEIKHAFAGTIFLTALVTTASLMPVDELPAASWQTALSLGFISAVFDNIPLTKLCLEQNGYDWGILAYAVGFGGSMIWFGSSAGVAISGKFPEARSVVNYVKNGWHVIVGYVLGFFALFLTMGWNPTMIEKGKEEKKENKEKTDSETSDDHAEEHAE
jgi:Na+/H+ antiporter NhaD/arsenite permease-like protein